VDFVRILGVLTVHAPTVTRKLSVITVAFSCAASSEKPEFNRFFCNLVLDHVKCLAYPKM
jgi:hypothetical protein